MKTRAQRSIEKELRKVLEEIRVAWTAADGDGDPFIQAVERFFVDEQELALFVNMLGWARGLAWTLRIHPARMWDTEF